MSFAIQSRLRQNLTNALSRSSFFGLGADAVLPRGVEAVHIADSELADMHVAAMLTIGGELVGEGLVFRERIGRNIAVVAFGEERFDGVLDGCAECFGR